MQGRSWMAALTLFAGLGFAVIVTGQGPASATADPVPAQAQSSQTPAKPSTSTAATGKKPGMKRQVELHIQIAGLSDEEATVVIKPGHPGCTFETITRKVKYPGRVDVAPFIVESRGADRDCAFSITIKEPGKPDKTVQRGLRLQPLAPGRPETPLSLACYLSSQSLAARDAAETTRKR